MRGYLLDTNIVMYWFDARRPQHERVMQRIEERPEATPLMISAITLGEIEFGLQIVQAATPDQETLRTFINTNLRNTAKVALSTLFTRIEQSWRLCSSVTDLSV